jgi:hypothetical protein
VGKEKKQRKKKNGEPRGVETRPKPPEQKKDGNKKKDIS